MSTSFGGFRVDNQVPETLISPPRGWISLELADLWHYRELLYFLAWRDLKVRYKQTAFGAAWAILQPLLMMALFTLIFGYFARLPSGNVPYPVFVFAGLLPWQLFSHALNQSSLSLIEDKNLLSKVYFPRLVIPFSSIITGLVDFAVAFLFYLVLMVVFQVPLTWRMMTLPLFVAFAILAALSVGLWLSALNVQYRDVRYTLPFLTQLWFFATPIVYPLSMIPENWRWLFALNPMTGVVEGFRWALLGSAAPAGAPILVSLVATSILLLGGLAYFKRMEDRFADVI